MLCKRCFVVGHPDSNIMMSVLLRECVSMCGAQLQQQTWCGCQCWWRTWTGVALASDLCQARNPGLGRTS